MEPTNYQSNSFKERNEREQIPKVVEGQVKVRKRSRIRRFADLFLAEDIGSVKDYVIFDILIPAVKDTIVNLINNTTEMLAYGRVKGKSTKASSYISYNSYSKPSTPAPIARPRVANSFDDIIFESRGEADMVLDTLRECVDQYGQVTVRDFLDAVGMSEAGYTNYTQNNYGWKDLRDAYVSRIREGYLLVMPRVMQLD